MIIDIFIAYGFLVNKPIINDFFISVYGKDGEKALRQIREQENNNNNNNGYFETLKGYIISLFKKLSEIIRFRQKGLIKYILSFLLRIFVIILAIDIAGGYLDFIPITGTIFQGIINTIINSFFIKNIANKLCSYCRNKIKREGIKNNILNQVIGYRKSMLLFQKLSQRRDWSRKIQILS